MKETGGYMFRVPNLPKEDYEKVNSMAMAAGASQWHVVVAAIRLLHGLGREAGSEKVREVAETATW